VKNNWLLIKAALILTQGQPCLYAGKALILIMSSYYLSVPQFYELSNLLQIIFLILLMNFSQSLQKHFTFNKNWGILY